MSVVICCYSKVEVRPCQNRLNSKSSAGTKTKKTNKIKKDLSDGMIKNVKIGLALMIIIPIWNNK
jgi:hypothetical protein